MTRQEHIARYLYENSAKRRISFDDLENDVWGKWMAMARHAMVAQAIWDDRRNKAA